MDIQFVLEAYSCVMYILSYVSKSEFELSDLLQEARLELLNDPSSNDLRHQMKKNKVAFILRIVKYLYKRPFLGQLV